jgi:hypothetical protein
MTTAGPRTRRRRRDTTITDCLLPRPLVSHATQMDHGYGTSARARRVVPSSRVVVASGLAGLAGLAGLQMNFPRVPDLALGPCRSLTPVPVGLTLAPRFADGGWGASH